MTLAGGGEAEFDEQLLGHSDESIVANIARFALTNPPREQAGDLVVFRIAKRLK